MNKVSVDLNNYCFFDGKIMRYYTKLKTLQKHTDFEYTGYDELLIKIKGLRDKIYKNYLKGLKSAIKGIEDKKELGKIRGDYLYFEKIGIGDLEIGVKAEPEQFILKLGNHRWYYVDIEKAIDRIICYGLLK